MEDVSRETWADGAVPVAVSSAYPEAAPGLIVLHQLLATDAVTWGLIGPREVPRLWDRHILNCAVVSELLLADPHGGGSLADIGSGAGLPGLVVALVRPDLRVTLIEPLARRATFLSEAVSTLGLTDRVEVIRARAEDLRGVTYRYVTARAVAPLDRLCGWALPLVADGGQFLAIKGRQAAQEVEAIQASGKPIPAMHIVHCGEGVVSPLTTVVVVDVTGSRTTLRSGSPRTRPNRGDRRD